MARGFVAVGARRGEVDGGLSGLVVTSPDAIAWTPEEQSLRLRSWPMDFVYPTPDLSIQALSYRDPVPFDRAWISDDRGILAHEDQPAGPVDAVLGTTRSLPLSIAHTVDGCGWSPVASPVLDQPDRYATGVAAADDGFLVPVCRASDALDVWGGDCGLLRSADGITWSETDTDFDPQVQVAWFLRVVRGRDRARPRIDRGLAVA